MRVGFVLVRMMISVCDLQEPEWKQLLVDDDGDGVQRKPAAKASKDLRRPPVNRLAKPKKKLKKARSWHYSRC